MALNSPQILTADPAGPLTGDDLEQVCAALREGALVVVPTETVYGLAARANDAGRKALAEAKGRDENKPIALLADSIDRFETLGLRFEGPARTWATAFWPGPLTLVVEGPQGFEGTRIPDHPVALSILEAIGEPLAVTSANRGGEAPALTAGEAIQALGDKVSVVVDAGPAVGKVASTVVRVEGDQYEVLREGALSSDNLRSVLGR